MKEKELSADMCDEHTKVAGRGGGVRRFRRRRGMRRAEKCQSATAARKTLSGTCHWLEGLRGINRQTRDVANQFGLRLIALISHGTGGRFRNNSNRRDVSTKLSLRSS